MSLIGVGTNRSMTMFKAALVIFSLVLIVAAFVAVAKKSDYLEAEKIRLQVKRQNEGIVLPDIFVSTEK